MLTVVAGAAKDLAGGIEWTRHANTARDALIEACETAKGRLVSDTSPFVSPSDCPWARIPFREKIPLEERKRIADKLHAAIPSSVLVVLEHGANCRAQGFYISKTRYIVAGSITHAMFKSIVLRRHACGSNTLQACWLHVSPPVVAGAHRNGGIMISGPTTTMAELHAKFCDPADGILYLVIDVENTFG